MARVPSLERDGCAAATVAELPAERPWVYCDLEGGHDSDHASTVFARNADGRLTLARTTWPRYGGRSSSTLLPVA